MEEIQIFENGEFGEVRTVMVDNKPYFCASDVARALGYSNPNKAINDHCKAITKRSTPISGKMQAINYIPEGDVYRLIIKSKLPNAEKFESWVVDEVLPIIRKHDAYMTEQTLEKALANPDFLIRLATQLKKEKEKNKRLEDDNERMKPKEIFTDAVTASDSSILIRELAKLIKQI